jgi:ABC-2 type transport system permease protein
VIVFGSAIVLGFLLLPLAFGVDDPLDPRRFTLFGIRTSRLALALAVAAAVSIPSVVVTVFAIAQVVTWSRGPLPVLLALLAVLIIVPTCILSARVSTALSSLFLSSRRARDITGAALIVLIAALAPLIALLASIDWESRALPIMRRIASVITWTPLGAAWSIPADAAAGRGEWIVKLVISVVFLAVLWFAWRALVGVMLSRPEREVGTQARAGLGWFERLPATPAGAIAARSMSYWGRDARYRVALAVIPVVPILMVVVLLVAGVDPMIIAWIPVPVMCLFLGWTVHNDVAHDSSAFWTHVSAHTSGRDDRWGRVIPALFLGVPIVLIGSIVSVGLVGNWGALPGLIGLSACVLLVGLGISSLISAAFPYPAVHPGDSPFAQPLAAGSSGSVIQAVSFFATIVGAAPVVALVVLGELWGAGWFWAALVVGVLVGAVALRAGVVLGGRIVSRHSPELLAFTLRN